ncbi:metallophosphoesterase [Antarctobacter jejuensis]|uniref:metallophosphoesterase n=1 Tax=Antarctobacter jejuensis TaxID=1439938 RepID=UPI003FD13DE8
MRDVPVPRLRIAVFADLHASAPYMGPARIKAFVDQTNALNADVILLLGDYVGHLLGGRDLAPDTVAAHLSALRAPLGVFAVFGNHDWRDDPQAQTNGTPTKWHRAFEEAGLSVLSNDAVVLSKDGAELTVAGLESQRALQTAWKRTPEGNDDLEAVLPKLDPGRFTLLMAHEPDIFENLPDTIDLTLSGHTHGGQIAPFGFPLVVPSRHGRRFAYGHHRAGSRQLVVSGGLGCSGLPIRIGRPPELVMVDLS